MAITINMNGDRFIFVLSGTTEGRQICQKLSQLGYPVMASVISDYGAQLTNETANCIIQKGKMDLSDMIDCLSQGAVCVIDATHPYAQEVTANAKEACRQTNVSYIRLQRPETEFSNDQSIIFVNDIQEAIAHLKNHTEGNVFLTTGSNALIEFTKDDCLCERLYARILPDHTSLQKAFDAKLKPDQIVAMKGPFSTEINIAMLKEVQATCLVTKDSGIVGGMPEKLEAAKLCGIETLVVRRPKESGCDMNAVIEQIKTLYGQPTKNIASKSNEIKTNKYNIENYFPFFVNIKNWKAVIIGGGTVAMRRANAFLRAGAKVNIIAPECIETCPEEIEWEQRLWRQGDASKADIVLAATNNREINQQVIQEAKQAKFYNACDDPSAGNFYFPAVLRSNALVLGMISGEPKKTKQWIQQLRYDWLIFEEMKEEKE